MAARTYRLPPAFYHDHVARDLPGGRIVRETRRHVFVELELEELEELLDDARHYAYSMAVGGFEGYGLIASARATVRALEGTEGR
jgi:hypothetical protein